MIRSILRGLSQLLTLATKSIAILFAIVLAAAVSAPLIEQHFQIRLPASQDAIWLGVAVGVIVMETMARSQIRAARRRRNERDAAAACKLIEAGLSDWSVRIEVTWSHDTTALLIVAHVEGIGTIEFMAAGHSRIENARRALGFIEAELEEFEQAAAERVFDPDEPIHPEPPRRGWWTTLGVSPDATIEEVNRAWRKLTAIHHPDRGGSDDAMAKVNVARDEAHRDLAMRASS
ncbi:J domain-containing protein [Bosea sp. RAC05]|uniref:J domain-containing protein n=1 Tax=Bosea sp. RAC05 TaxID=1842539 RepID=UPI00083D940A|nr:J domain-containing protein [Bosea sp. RAC05]AOG03151.1 dnaJ domain protein [Bosea sp. RAC05]